MIEKFEIFDYRSCSETTINLQPDLTVLIGPNGSGKTNILNAFLLLRSLTNEEVFRAQRVVEASNECRLKASFRCEGKKSILTTDIQLHTDENNSDVILNSDYSWYIKEYTGNASRIKTPLWARRYFISRRLHSPLKRRIRGYSSFELRKHIEPESFRIAFEEISVFLEDIKYYSA